ncbi:hypothetical protein I3V78_23920 [Archangium primigenium]|nr:hypothetical protein [Archangium primigenium]
MDWVQQVERENSTGHESAEGVVATADGFCVFGHTNSRRPGVDQAWVLRFGMAPPPRWERTYGAGERVTGTLSRAMASLPGGGFIVVGEQESVGRLFLGWLLALSPEGEVLWERTLGLAEGSALQAVAVLEDGSIVAGGSQSREGWVVRVDSRGEVLWDVQLPQLERVTALVALPAQRVAVLGTAETSSVALGVSRLFLLESDGRVTAEKRFPEGVQGELVSMALLPEGGLIATGRQRQSAPDDDRLWVVRMDPRGELLWEYLPEGTSDEAGLAITALPDGGAVVLGYNWKEMLVDREAKVWRFSADGRLVWQQSYGGAKEDLGTGIARLADESLVVVGMTTSQGAGKTDLWTFGLSPEGQLLWEETFGAK